MTNSLQGNVSGIVMVSLNLVGDVVGDVIKISSTAINEGETLEQSYNDHVEKYLNKESTTAGEWKVQFLYPTHDTAFVVDKLKINLEEKGIVPLEGSELLYQNEDSKGALDIKVLDVVKSQLDVIVPEINDNIEKALVSQKEKQDMMNERARRSNAANLVRPKS